MCGGKGGQWAAGPACGHREAPPRSRQRIGGLAARGPAAALRPPHKPLKQYARSEYPRGGAASQRPPARGHSLLGDVDEEVIDALLLNVSLQLRLDSARSDATLAGEPRGVDIIGHGVRRAPWTVPLPLCGRCAAMPRLREQKIRGGRDSTSRAAVQRTLGAPPSRNGAAQQQFPPKGRRGATLLPRRARFASKLHRLSLPGWTPKRRWMGRHRRSRPTRLTCASPTQAELLSSISEDELEEFREIFGLVDRDGGGSISKSELAELLDTLGVSASKVRHRGTRALPAGPSRIYDATLPRGPAQDEIDLMVSEIDEDGNAEIDFEGPAARNAFSAFSRGGGTPSRPDGGIGRTEFVIVMSRRVNTQYTPAQIKQAFKVPGTAAPLSNLGPPAVRPEWPRGAGRCAKAQLESDAARHARRVQVFQDAGSPPGKIHIDRVVLALTTFGTRKLSAEAARELALQMEPDVEGWINFNSFVEAIAQ